MRGLLAHHHYIYTSERLLREVHDRATAQPEGRIHSADVTITSPIGIGVTVGMGGGTDGSENTLWVAEFALRALQDQIASLSTAAEGRYLRAVLNLTCCVLPVANMSTTVAWMYAEHSDPDTGRITLIGLCGSTKNYRDAVPGSRSLGTELGDGWYPSSLMGLRQVFAMRADDEEVKNVQDWESMEDPVDTAMRYTELPPRDILDEGWKEVLAEVLVTKTVERQIDGYDAVLLAAPLWVRSAPALRVKQDGAEERKPEAAKTSPDRARRSPATSTMLEPSRSGFVASPLATMDQTIEVAGAIMAGVGGLLIVIGSLLPWLITVDPVARMNNATGLRAGYGLLTLISGVVTVLIAVMRLNWGGMPEIVRRLSIASGMFVGLVAAANYMNMQRQAITMVASDSSVTIVGPGLWILLVGAVFAVLGGVATR